MADIRIHNLAGPRTCQDCGASVMFRWSENNRKMILDLPANPEGNVVVKSDGTMHVLTKAEKASIAPEITRYMDHHVTCPHRDKWKKKKRGS